MIDKTIVSATNIKVGGMYNWRGQSDRLVYTGRYRDNRNLVWYNFERIDAPGFTWCEISENDLSHFEETQLYREDFDVIDPTQWEPCSPEWINKGGDCANSPRIWHAKTCNHWHPKIFTKLLSDADIYQLIVPGDYLTAAGLIKFAKSVLDKAGVKHE